LQSDNFKGPWLCRGLFSCSRRKSSARAGLRTRGTKKWGSSKAPPVSFPKIISAHSDGAKCQLAETLPNTPIRLGSFTNRAWLTYHEFSISLSVGPQRPRLCCHCSQDLYNRLPGVPAATTT